MKRPNNILVVEDEEQWRNIYKRALNRLDLPFDIATTRDEAFELTKTKCYDVAFVDLSLIFKHELDRQGTEVMQKINEQNPPPTIYIVSGYAVAEDIRDGFKKYCIKDYMKKTGELINWIPDAVQKGIGMFAEALKGRGDARSLLIPHYIKAWEWESMVINALKPRGGADIFKFVEKNLRYLYPTIRHKTYYGMQIDSGRCCMYATIWSKSLGQSVLLIIGHKDYHDIICNDLDKFINSLATYNLGDLIFEDIDKRTNIFSRVYYIKNATVNDFSE